MFLLAKYQLFTNQDKSNYDPRISVLLKVETLSHQLRLGARSEPLHLLAGERRELASIKGS